ncbi:hypothetical protein PJH57_29125, partial [Mycobacterium kansasii]
MRYTISIHYALPFFSGLDNIGIANTGTTNTGWFNSGEIERAHDRTPDTTTNLVIRLELEIGGG